MIFSIYVIGFSQDRTNDELPIISKNIGQLTIAKGWLKNSSGQWVGRNNKIISDLGTDTKVLENYEKYSVGADNFISLEIKNIKIKDSSHVLLLKKYRDGFYEYKTIESGWNPENSCKYYVLSIDEFDKIKNLNKETSTNLYLDVIYQGDIKYIDLKNFTNNTIAKYKPIDDYGSNMLGLNISCFKNKNIVQFYFYDTYRYKGKYIDTYGSGMTENWEKYYETDFVNFNKFINIQ